FCLIIRRSPISTLFPYTTLFRSFRKQAPRTLFIESQDASLRATPQHVFFAYDDLNNRIVERSADALALGDNLILVDSWDWRGAGDRKSTRLNSSHSQISYAVFCL